MPCIAYVNRRFGSKACRMIEIVNGIIDEYTAKGFSLTLRQLYYQCVARDYIPNNQKSYDNLGNLVSNARLAGLIDWNAIEDRTRFLRSLSHWGSPQEILNGCAQQYRIDKWATQPRRPEVWIEKDALAGIFERVCQELDVPYLSCRGYTSQSEMWGAAQRLIRYSDAGQEPIILHFGDHDPSGIDMTRDIRDRLQMFTQGLVEVNRLALNMDQVDEYGPPPNPAKLSDARAASYIRVYGRESWELDALSPDVLAGLVRDTIISFRDEKAWRAAVEEEQDCRKKLSKVAEKWETLTKKL